MCYKRNYYNDVTDASLYFNKHQCYKHEPLSSSIFFSIAQGKEAKTAIKKSI